MTYTRFLQIKGSIKLNNSNLSPKQGELYYDREFKYDYAFKVIIESCNEFTWEVDLDLIGNTTTYAHNSYGKPGSRLLEYIIGKPNVTRGV